MWVDDFEARAGIASDGCHVEFLNILVPVAI
jgi:hypothetical protein